MKTIIDVMLGVAIEAGTQARIMRDSSKNAQRGGYTMEVIDKGSQGRDIATAADQNAQKIISDALREHTPDIPQVGEEGDEAAMSMALRADTKWIFDPLDGTKNYSRGSSHWGVMIALVQGGKPVKGVIYLPSLSMFYVAEVGQGISINYIKQPPLLSVETRREVISLKKAVLGAEWGYWMTDRQMRQQNALIKLLSGPHQSLSAAFAISEVCQGITDGYLNLHKPDEGACIWDFAAGALLVAEALGLSVDEVACDPEGNPLDWTQKYMQALICKPGVRQEVLEILRTTE